MGEVWAPFEREWIFPLGTITLEGRTLPAPARPEPLLDGDVRARLEGPRPRLPLEKDPTPRSAASTRGSAAPASTGRSGTTATASRGCCRRTSPRTHLAEHLHEREDADTWVLDIGCGRGRDVRWLAKQGRPAVGLDYSATAMTFIADKAAQHGWPAELRTMNLLELRQVLAWGALLAARPGPRTVLARHLVDCTSPVGVDNFWRLVGMVLRPGERVHLEFLTEADRGRGGPPAADPARRRGRRASPTWWRAAGSSPAARTWSASRSTTGTARSRPATSNGGTTRLEVEAR